MRIDLLTHRDVHALRQPFENQEHDQVIPYYFFAIKSLVCCKFSILFVYYDAFGSYLTFRIHNIYLAMTTEPHTVELDCCQICLDDFQPRDGTAVVLCGKCNFYTNNAESCVLSIHIFHVR